MPENDTQRTVDSNKLMDDVISDYEQRIAAIQQAKKTMGRDAAVLDMCRRAKAIQAFIVWERTQNR